MFKCAIRVNKHSDWFCVCLSNFNVMFASLLFASPIVPCALSVFLSLVSLASRVLGNPRQFWILDSTLGLGIPYQWNMDSGFQYL